MGINNPYTKRILCEEALNIADKILDTIKRELPPEKQTLEIIKIVLHTAEELLEDRAIKL